MRELPPLPPEPPAAAATTTTTPRGLFSCFSWRRLALGLAAVLFASGAVLFGVGRNRRTRWQGLTTALGEGEGEAETGPPRCYSASSPEADPSEGAWRRSRNGVLDSPAHRDDWVLPSMQFAFLKTCDMIWNNDDHPGPERPRPYWTWKPTNCTLEAVDEAKFCRVMEGRKGLLLVGDSLTRLMTTTLASMLGAEAESIDLFQDNWRACGGALRVRFVRNDYLDTRTEPAFVSDLCEHPVGVPVENSRCRMFATDEVLGDFDTLVVNSGAHPRGPDEFREEMHAAADALTSAMHRLHGEDRAVLVVRNTSPGHWGCTQRMLAGPVPETTALKLVKAAPEKYQWRTFHGRNYHIEHAFSPAKGWRLLDAYTPTLLRADSHIGGVDCLHYCVPGPADHWVTLLYNILLAAKDEQV